jgi:uncharacterized membrane protein YjjB (DUF3815 family)
MYILVPLFSAAKSLSNLQSWRSWHFVAMIFVSCASFASTVACKKYFSVFPAIVSFTGGFTVSFLVSLWSRLFRGTAFTVGVTGVLFLVPVRKTSML